MSDTAITILGLVVMAALLLRWVYWERRLKKTRQEGTDDD
jgi:hypothetical protein